MPAFSATRETPNASVRCATVVTSAIIALLAVRNCAQPKAASTTMSTTITARSRVSPSPKYKTMLPRMATMSTGRRPNLSHRAPPAIWMGSVASSARPRMSPTVVIETSSSPLRYSVSYGYVISTPMRKTKMPAASTQNCRGSVLRSATTRLMEPASTRSPPPAVRASMLPGEMRAGESRGGRPATGRDDPAVPAAPRRAAVHGSAPPGRG